MKIGLFSPYDMFKGGGVQEHIAATQVELNKRGHDAVIITPQPRSYKGETPKGMIFLGGSADFKSPLHTVVQVSATSSPDETIAAVLDTEQFDVLHLHEPWIPIVSRQLLSRSKAVNIGTFHARLPDTRVSKTIERVIKPYTKSILKYIDFFTAVSDPAAQYLRHLAKVDVQLIPNGIDLKKYKPDTSASFDKPTIFYVGRLEKRKGVKYLIKAFKLLQHRLPDVQLLIGGTGPDREKLEALVAEQQIPNVQFLGYLEDAEKIRFMQKADVFCSPALYGESFGIVLLEAMACATPVVAGANPGYQTVLGGTGALGIVNSKDASDFARRLEIFLTNQDLRKMWQGWAKDYIKQFDYSHIVDQYEALYNEACKNRRDQAA
jgi:phosphatidyl-myo-inositol alpha-mannosyltransferase